jgi:hypothetical protein
MKNVIRISRQEFFANEIANEKTAKGCNFIGIDMLTNVDLTGGQKNPMQGRVTKVHNNFLAMIFSNKNRSSYQDMVNRRLALEGKEGNFEAGKLPWGTRILGTSGIVHKDTNYIQLIYVQKAVNLAEYATKELGITLTDADLEVIEYMKNKVVKFETTNGNVTYLLDGKPIEKSKIIGLKESSNGKQGGLSDDMKAIIRSPKVESFTRVTMNGSTYILED